MRTIRDEEEDPGVTLDEAICRKHTDKAGLYDLGSRGEVWIPHSQLHEDSEFYYDEDEDEMSTDGPATLVITSWIAEQKGLD